MAFTAILPVGLTLYTFVGVGANLRFPVRDDAQGTSIHQRELGGKQVLDNWTLVDQSQMNGSLGASSRRGE